MISLQKTSPPYTLTAPHVRYSSSQPEASTSTASSTSYSAVSITEEDITEPPERLTHTPRISRYAKGELDQEDLRTPQDYLLALGSSHRLRRTDRKRLRHKILSLVQRYASSGIVEFEGHRFALAELYLVMRDEKRDLAPVAGYYELVQGLERVLGEVGEEWPAEAAGCALELGKARCEQAERWKRLAKREKREIEAMEGESKQALAVRRGDLQTYEAAERDEKRKAMQALACVVRHGEETMLADKHVETLLVAAADLRETTLLQRYLERVGSPTPIWLYAMARICRQTESKSLAELLIKQLEHYMQTSAWGKAVTQAGYVAGSYDRTPRSPSVAQNDDFQTGMIHIVVRLISNASGHAMVAASADGERERARTFLSFLRHRLPWHAYEPIAAIFCTGDLRDRRITSTVELTAYMAAHFGQPRTATTAKVCLDAATQAEGLDEASLAFREAMLAFASATAALVPDPVLPEAYFSRHIDLLLAASESQAELVDQALATYGSYIELEAAGRTIAWNTRETSAPTIAGLRSGRIVALASAMVRAGRRDAALRFVSGYAVLRSDLSGILRPIINVGLGRGVTGSPLARHVAAAATLSIRLKLTPDPWLRERAKEALTERYGEVMLLPAGDRVYLEAYAASPEGDRYRGEVVAVEEREGKPMVADATEAARIRLFDDDERTAKELSAAWLEVMKGISANRLLVLFCSANTSYRRAPSAVLTNASAAGQNEPATHWREDAMMSVNDRPFYDFRGRRS